MYGAGFKLSFRSRAQDLGFVTSFGDRILGSNGVIIGKPCIGRMETTIQRSGVSLGFKVLL